MSDPYYPENLVCDIRRIVSLKVRREREPQRWCALTLMAAGKHRQASRGMME